MRGEFLRALGGCAGCLFLLIGCSRNVYELELKPEGSALERKLTVWRESTSGGELQVISKEELTRIAAAYPGTTPPEKSAAEKFTFQGKFLDTMPQDIGGFGWFERWETPLGTAAVYIERFRGDDDLVGHFERRQKAVDEIANLLVAWVEEEFAGLKGEKELRAFVDQDLRRDALNVSLYALTYQLAEGDNTSDVAGALARATQYLMERNYLRPEQIPQWTREISNAAERQNYGGLARLIEQTFAKKLGYEGQPIPAALARFEEPELLVASLEKFLRATPQYAVLRAEWEQDHADDEEKPAPPPGFAIVEAKLLPMLLPPLASVVFEGDELRVQMAGESLPIFTNGQWQPEAQEVHWKRSLAREYPATIFVAWASPNVIAQEKHFGRVVLRDGELAMYCLWYRGLSMAETAEWDAFVSALRPGPALRAELQAFRFGSDPPVEEEKKKGLAHSVIEMMAEKLAEE